MRTLKITAVMLMALGLLLALASTYAQEVRISSKRYDVKLEPKSEIIIKHRLNVSTVYLRVSCSMSCDTRVLVEVNEKFLGLNCTENVGVLDVATTTQEAVLASIMVENYADSNRTVTILLNEIGSIYPYREFSIIGYFIWMTGFLSILIFVFRKTTEKYSKRGIK